MKCPQCYRRLRVEATNCLCGWKSEGGYEPQFRGPDCSVIGCLGRTMSKMHTPTGWANFCYEHYIAHEQKKADAFCAERGIDTTEKKIAYCRRMVGKIGAGRPSREWAEVLLTRLAAGEKITYTQERFAKEALGVTDE